MHVFKGEIKIFGWKFLVTKWAQEGSSFYRPSCVCRKAKYCLPISQRRWREGEPGRASARGAPARSGRPAHPWPFPLTRYPFRIPIVYMFKLGASPQTRKENNFNLHHASDRNFPIVRDNLNVAMEFFFLLSFVVSTQSVPNQMQMQI